MDNPILIIFINHSNHSLKFTVLVVVELTKKELRQISQNDRATKGIKKFFTK